MHPESPRGSESSPALRDTADCGRRHLTLPASKTGVNVPDDSCATANNGRCEDQLFFSVIFPNGNRGSSIAKCAPNT